MKKKVLLQLLDEQAAELQRGTDPTAEMQAVFRHEPRVMAGLLELGQRLKHSLRPVEPSPGFVADLKIRLLERLPGVPHRPAGAEIRERRLLLAVAGLAALAYTATITAFGVRMLIDLLGLVRLTGGLRRSRLAYSLKT